MHANKTMEKEKEKAVGGGVTPLILEDDITGRSPGHTSVFAPIFKKSEKSLAKSSGPITSQASEAEQAQINQTINELPASTRQANRLTPLVTIIELAPLAAESEHADPPPQYVRTQLSIT